MNKDKLLDLAESIDYAVSNCEDYPLWLVPIKIREYVYDYNVDYKEEANDGWEFK